MSYLAVKRVKGRYYAYRQESFLEGGKVRTRTIEYLGAVDPALAARIRTRDIAVIPKQNAAPITSHELADEVIQSDARRHPRSLDASSQANSEDRMQVTINGEAVLIDRHTGEILKTYGKVITTRIEAHALRPFSQSLMLPNLEDYGASTTALRGTHARYGRRLSALKINPAFLSDVKVEYGHPNQFRSNADGSYSVVVSRRPDRKRHQINKIELWKNFRQALSHSYLDAIEQGSPNFYDDLRLVFDYHYRESQRLALEAICVNADPLKKVMLSLQIKLWHQLPGWVKKKASPSELGQINLDRQTGWRDEAAEILAAVQKSGWDEMDKRVRNTRAKLKSRITKRLNIMADVGSLGDLSLRLSGKRRRLFREIRETEFELQALEQLEHRLGFLKENLPR